MVKGWNRGEKGVASCCLPVASHTPATPFDPPTLQARFGEDTSVTGELFGWEISWYIIIDFEVEVG